MTSGPLRSILTRFLPACTGVIAAFLFARLLADPSTFGWEHWLLGAAEALGLTFGFGAVVAAVRSRTVVEPHRPWGAVSVAAGAIAPLALGLTSVFTQAATLPGIAFASLVVGGILGGALTLPWLMPWAAPVRLAPPKTGGLTSLPQPSARSDPGLQFYAEPANQSPNGTLRAR